jgi:hypothetical protein
MLANYVTEHIDSKIEIYFTYIRHVFIPHHNYAACLNSALSPGKLHSYQSLASDFSYIPNAFTSNFMSTMFKT